MAAVGVVVATAVCAGFAASHTPLTDGSAHLARSSWNAVAEVALGPEVKTIYVDIGNRDAMPEAAAIADQAVRHHRRVELNRAALYFVDPSFAARSVAQLRVVVCCGRGDPSRPAAGPNVSRPDRRPAHLRPGRRPSQAVVAGHPDPPRARRWALAGAGRCSARTWTTGRPARCEVRVWPRKMG